MKVFSLIGRHPRLFLFIGGLSCVSCPIWILVAPINARIGRKSDAWHSPDLPAARVGAGQPILQLESHTCGLLSLSAAYALYGLSPEDKNLRYRLGVDVPANPLDPASKGTLHPDLLRVLVQDGFSYRMPSPISDLGVEQLRAHLRSGDVAILLIRRSETGGLHWVVADDCTGDMLRIVDSLHPQPRLEPLDHFANHAVLSIILISPGPAGGGEEVPRAHQEGSAEILRVKSRLDRLNQLDN